MTIRDYLAKYPTLKRFVHRLLIPRGLARPRRWVSWLLNPFVHQHHPSAAIRATVRLDVLPFNRFDLGAHSLIEDFSVINNGVGDVVIGANTHLGIGAVIIGPVRIGSDVILAQHVVLSGLNHAYEDIQTPIWKQPVATQPIVIEDECWLGANVTITAGITIGRHTVVAGGSVVTRNVPPYTVVGGNPARILKQYDAELGEWVSNADPSGKDLSHPIPMQGSIPPGGAGGRFVVAR